MDHAHRPFQSNNDLFAAARLVRSAFAHAPYWNAWNFARVDIWAQRRISDVALYGYTDWQRALQVWETSRGELAGAVAFTGLIADKPDPNHIAILSHPDYSDLYPEMLDWAEAKRASMFPPGSISVEVMMGHPCLEALLRARGYTPSRDWMFKRFRKLGGQIETYTLPAGFSLIELDQLDD